MPWKHVFNYFGGRYRMPKRIIGPKERGNKRIEKIT
jgi:hypothetical protein